MELTGRSRWFVLALPVALAAVASLVRPAPPGAAAAGRLLDRACGTTVAVPVTASGAAWYRLDPVLDPGGTLTGRRLTAGRGTVRWSAVLPAESFTAGPVGGRVVVGDDDGRRSQLRLLDTARACWTAVETSGDVVRSAVLASDGVTLYEHRVDRVTRGDLGIWRRSLADRTGRAVQVLPGLAPDAWYGPTYATSLQVADDGRVVVSACGERACRTRVLDPSSGAVASVNGTGPAAGLAGGRLIALEPCDGLPCAVDSVDLAAGTAMRLGEADGPVLATSSTSGVVVLAVGSGLSMVRVSPEGSDLEVPDGAGLAPVTRSSTSDSGVEAPAGRIAVAPGGTVTDPASVRFLDPATAALSAGEVLP